MGLSDAKCDSCGQKVDVLFPIAILDDLPSGVSKLVQRWYCLVCKETIEEEAELMESDDDDEEEEKGREHKCGCKYKLFMKDETLDVWKIMFLCQSHGFEGSDNVVYSCGCVVKEIGGDFYIYTVVCDKHV